MADLMKKMGKGGMKKMAAQMAGMGGGGLGGGLGGMLGGAPDPGMLEAAKGNKGKGPKGEAAEDIDFDAIEKALSGKGALPPGLGGPGMMGGLPGLGKKK